MMFLLPLLVGDAEAEEGEGSSAECGRAELSFGAGEEFQIG